MGEITQAENAPEGWGKSLLHGALRYQTGVPLAQWGKEQFDRIYQQVEEGDSQLIFDEKNREVLRRVRIVAIDIFYHDADDNVLRLVEDRQEFRNGKIVRRHWLMGSVAEKMKEGEDVKIATQRALREELGIDGKDLVVEEVENRQGISESKSYPGLQTEYVVHQLRIVLPMHYYQPGGYKEEQPDKTTYFKWVREKAPH